MNNLNSSLRLSGLRNTAQRRELLSCLMAQRQPVAAEDLRPLLGMDPVTIYRTLEQFEKSGLVRRVVFDDGIRRYEVVSEHHHHHLVCDNCGQVQDIIIPNEQEIVHRIIARQHFKTRTHSMEFFGLCVNCN